jgi:hypothetical protein
MSFSVEWLALRERYDLAARNAAVLGGVADAFLDRSAIAVVDLACGTGATLRAIGPHLPPQQSWRLVDNDLSLLAKASTGNPPHVTVATKPVDLVRDLELALEEPLDLVTASALLDLVSPEWLDRLIIEAAARQLPVYAALSYDGRAALEPQDAFDAVLLAGFNRHQRTDKGFGPALGPTAAASAVERFEHFGFAVLQGRSDWVLGPDDHDIQNALLVGWLETATQTTELSVFELSGWLDRRQRHLADGRSNMRIGHVDILATPIGMR